MLTRNDLKRLRQINKYPCITITLPTKTAMPERKQNQILVKNLVTKAKDQLSEEFKPNKIAKVFDNLDKAVHNIDYSNVMAALMIFVNEDGAQIYKLPLLKVRQKVVIDSRFDLRDLERYFNKGYNYWVLTLSQQPTRLFMGRHDTLVEIKDTQVSRDQEGPYPPLWHYDVMEPWSGFPYERDYDVYSDRELLAVGTGDKDAKYLDRFKEAYYREVDELLANHLAQDNPAPIILLGTDNNRAIFKEISKHNKLIIGEHGGDYSTASIEQIEKITHPIAVEHIKKRKEQFLNTFKEDAIKADRYAFGFDWVWRVAKEGRINKLLIERKYQVQGTLDDDNNPHIEKEYIRVNPEDNLITDDLVNDLISLVIDKGGEIIFLEPNEIKEYKHVAALLRY